MKVDEIYPPREFYTSPSEEIRIKDCAKIYLESNEMVSFVTPSGKEHDFVAKQWGFYVTPSVNSRLVNQGFKTALVLNPSRQHYIMVIDTEKMTDFEQYLDETKQEVVQWLDELA